MDCGFRGQMLKRHLGTVHGLTVLQYRKRWDLSRDHVVTAPSYSERRSLEAKRLGLGRAGKSSVEITAMSEADTAARRVQGGVGDRDQQ